MVNRDSNISKTRKFIKNQILNNGEFVGYEVERRQVFNLLQTTIETGESNSALLIGPHGIGKTTLVNDVLKELQPAFINDAILVKLNGFIHTTDNLALRAITIQLNLENASEGKVFGSFADNLAFLLACLKSGDRNTSRSIIFIIEEFDLFCSHHNQTLLYNLFDVAQSAQAPICVLGTTCRIDVIELLEKRVKSRFSHRQLFLFPEQMNLTNRLKRIEQLLTIPTNPSLKIAAPFRREWNKHVETLLKNASFKKMISWLLDIDWREQILKNMLFIVVSKLNEDNNQITVEAFKDQMDDFQKDHLIEVLKDLSILELCLIIAMKHHDEIYDNQPMNFEMVLTRYMKFANAHASVQSVERPVVMKAFEHLENLELIQMIGAATTGLQREYQLFKLQVLPIHITEAVKKRVGLPTEVMQWACNSFI